MDSDSRYYAAAGIYLFLLVRDMEATGDFFPPYKEKVRSRGKKPKRAKDEKLKTQDKNQFRNEKKTLIFLEKK